MRGLQGVRGALHGSPGLFCLDRAAHFSQAGLGSSECARLLRYHYDGAGVTPLWQGWGRRARSPMPITALSLCGARRLRASAPF